MYVHAPGHHIYGHAPGHFQIILKNPQVSVRLGTVERTDAHVCQAPRARVTKKITKLNFIVTSHSMLLTFLTQALLLTLLMRLPRLQCLLNVC